MRTRIVCSGLTMVLVALMLTLTELAYASPTDPTWNRGMWDDADFDEIVDYITFASGLVEVIATPDLRGGHVLLILLLLSPGPIVSLDPPAARHPRAPPTV